VLFGNLSRVIALNLRTAVVVAAAAAALEEGQVMQVVVLALNAIAAARSVTLRVHAPRLPEAVQEEATAVAGEEATVVLGAAAVRKLGALSFASSLVASPEG